MYYDQDFVDDLVEELSIPGGDSYVQVTALAIGKMLEKSKEIYKSFGVYWWAMKEALQKYYPNKEAWFMGPYDDPGMKHLAWHGDLFRTVLAGAKYHGDQMFYTSDHEWTDKEGNDRTYYLFDANAGF